MKFGTDGELIGDDANVLPDSDSDWICGRDGTVEAPGVTGAGIRGVLARRGRGGGGRPVPDGLNPGGEACSWWGWKGFMLKIAKRL